MRSHRVLLSGGAGHDTLAGNAGADRFQFTAPGDSAVGAGRDVIEDFFRSEGDRIDVSAIDAKPSIGEAAFDFIGTAGFTAGQAGQLRYEIQSGVTLVQMETTGDAFTTARTFGSA